MSRIPPPPARLFHELSVTTKRHTDRHTGGQKRHTKAQKRHTGVIAMSQNNDNRHTRTKKRHRLANFALLPLDHPISEKNGRPFSPSSLLKKGSFTVILR